MYTGITSTLNSILNLSACTDAVTTWHIQNDLPLNLTKMEALVTGTRQQVTKIDQSAGIMVTGASASFVNKFRVLGVTSIVKTIVRRLHYYRRTSLQLPYPSHASNPSSTQPRSGQYNRMLNSVLETTLLQRHTLWRDGAQYQSPSVRREQYSSSHMRCFLPIVCDQPQKVATLAADRRMD